MTHVASDLHLGHKNIIEYCERPFDSVSEMNDTLLKNWNECVGPNERVLYLGDLAPFEDRTHVVQGWLNKLNGQFLFIEGNHDPAIPITTHESYCLNLSGSGLRLRCLSHPLSGRHPERLGWMGDLRTPPQQLSRKVPVCRSQR